MPLDTLPVPVPATAPPLRLIDERDGALFLLEVGADGGCDIVGPLTSHHECEDLARTLLAIASPGLAIPAPLHKLCVAYMAARGRERSL